VSASVQMILFLLTWAISGVFLPSASRVSSSCHTNRTRPADEGSSACLPLLTTTLTTFLTAAVAATLTTTLAAAVAAARLVSAATAAALGWTPLTATVSTTAAAAAAAIAASLLSSVASTVSTTATSIAAASGSAATSTVGSLVDTDPASVELLVVHGLHSGIGLAVLRIANEAKASAAASITVLDYDGFFDLTELFELLAKSLVVGMPCKASNKEFRHGGSDVWIEQFSLAAPGWMGYRWGKRVL